MRLDTRWATLSDFVKYLGKKGKCIVDETEQGWYLTCMYSLLYVQYIEVDASIKF
jgi:Domain of Kin17 curved DNA-binding protein